MTISELTERCRYAEVRLMILASRLLYKTEPLRHGVGGRIERIAPPKPLKLMTKEELEAYYQKGGL